MRIPDLLQPIQSDLNFLFTDIGTAITIKTDLVFNPNTGLYEWQSTSTKALINNRTSSSYYDEKKIHILGPLKAGNYIEHDNKTCIVISEVATTQYLNKNRGIMRLCPFVLKYQPESVIPSH